MTFRPIGQSEKSIPYIKSQKWVRDGTSVVQTRSLHLAGAGGQRQHRGSAVQNNEKTFSVINTLLFFAWEKRNYNDTQSCLKSIRRY